jgi:hypothetical protein
MRHNQKSRRGIAIIVVLMMISVTMAVSYAILRLQSTSTHVQQNADRRGSARNAAMVGLAAGIRAMHISSWSGVGTSLTGTVSSTDSYSVAFTAGDDSLTIASPNYADWHFRVTVVSTGTSANPGNSQLSSIHKMKAVLQLVPRQLNSEPTNWSQVKQYTVYQTNTGPFQIDVPARVEGAVRLQGAVKIDTEYLWSSNARNRYFSDLSSMRSARNEIQTITVTNATGGSYRLSYNGVTSSSIAYNAAASTVRSTLGALSSIGGTANVTVAGNSGGPYTVTFVNDLAAQDVPQITVYSSSLSGSTPSVSTELATQGAPGYIDCRPLNGPLYLPWSSTNSTNQTLITSLGISTNNISVSQSMNLPFPSSLPTYRIYTGGPTYNVPQVGSSLSNTTLAPDPTTNPLGIYFSSGNVTLGSNVTIQGTLVSQSGISISGAGVNFTPLDLRPLTNSSTPVRLPAAAVQQNLYVGNSVSATINGFVLVGQQFQIDRGQQSTTFGLTGRLITNEFLIRRRSEWDFSNLVWGLYYTLFSNQLSNINAIPFFPVYAVLGGCNPIPTLTIKADPSSLVEHWQDLSQPIYVKHSEDPGLRWDVIRVTPL